MSKLNYSLPEDKSLAAYKKWILGMSAAMTGAQAVDDMSSQEWEKDWRDFWAQQKKPPQQGAAQSARVN